VSSVGEMLLEPALHGLDANGASQRGELGVREALANIKAPDWDALESNFAGPLRVKQAASGTFSPELDAAGQVACPSLRGAACLVRRFAAPDEAGWPEQLWPPTALVHTQPLDMRTIHGAVAALNRHSPDGNAESSALPAAPAGTAWVNPHIGTKKAVEAAIASCAHEDIPVLALVSGDFTVESEVRSIMSYLRAALQDYALWWARANPTAECPLLSTEPETVHRVNTTLGLVALQLSPSMRLRMLGALKLAGALGTTCQSMRAASVCQCRFSPLFCTDSSDAGWIKGNYEQKLRVRACILLWGSSPEPNAEAPAVPPRELFRFYQLQPNILQQCRGAFSAGTLVSQSALVDSLVAASPPLPPSALDAASRAGAVFASFPSKSAV